MENIKISPFEKNIDKWADIVSFYRWYPDLFFDLIKKTNGGIEFGLDQRVMIRSICRFSGVSMTYPRGYGKTFIEVLAMVHTCIFYPNIFISMSSVTKENAAMIMEEKITEILDFYPLLENEIQSMSFSKDSAKIIFVNNSKIDVLANAQSSKGKRRKRLSIEEAGQVNFGLFDDVLSPIVNVPRRTMGKKAEINPEELNGQICFYTTATYRGSAAYDVNVAMFDDMAELKGKFVCGSSWELGVAMQRGESKAQILDRKANTSPMFFKMNFESEWCGATSDAICDIGRLMALRTIEKYEDKAEIGFDYVMAIDVARSHSTSNNQSSVAILKIYRGSNGGVQEIHEVNLYNISNALNFTGQAIEVKRIYNKFKPKTVVIDTNGLGVGLLDMLTKQQIDPMTGEILRCWDTINTEAFPDMDNAIKCVYDLKPQSAEHECNVAFIDYVDTGILKLLIKKRNTDYDSNDYDAVENIAPYIQTDFLIDEISNLQLEQIGNGKTRVKQAVKKINKDRFSALKYGLFIIKTFESATYSNSDEFKDLEGYFGFF